MCHLSTALRVVGKNWSPASKWPPASGLMWGWSYTTHLKVVCPAVASFSHSPGSLHRPPPEQGYPTALHPSSRATNRTQGASLLRGLRWLPRYKLLAGQPALVQNNYKSQGCYRHLKSCSEVREGLSCSHDWQLNLRHFKRNRISKTLGENHFPKTTLPCRASGWFPRISWSLLKTHSSKFYT